MKDITTITDACGVTGNLKFLRKAAKASLARGYNPLKGHCEDDHPVGASWFETPAMTDVVNFLGAVEVDDSLPDGWFFHENLSSETVKVFSATQTQEIWGWFARTDPDSVEEIRIGIGPHGNLEPQAEAPQVEEIPTGETTAIAVFENGEWLLAALYPGDYEPLPDLSGLKEGDIITPVEAEKRGILRVKKAAVTAE